MPSLLFVYGTLKRGDVRAPLLNGQTFLGDTQTLPAYRLFNVGDYPAMVAAQPIGLPGLAIRGELYRVDDACLARLDEEEGVEEGLYERCLIELAGGQSAWTYCYLYPTDSLPDCGDHWDGAC